MSVRCTFQVCKYFFFCLNRYLIYEEFCKKHNSDDDTQWMKAVFAKSCLHIKISDRIATNLKKEGNKLVAKVKKANKKGGKCTKHLKETWKKLSNRFTFLIYFNEIEEKLELFKKLDDAEKERDKVKREVNENQVKQNDQMKLYEEKLGKMNSQLSHYKTRFQKMARRALAIERKTRGPSKRKSFDDLSGRQQKRIRNQLSLQCEEKLTFLSNYNFVAMKIEIFNMDTKELETLNLVKENTKSCKELTDSEVKKLNMILLVKENFNISDKAFKELSMLSEDLPSFHSISKRIKELDDQVVIVDCPDGIEGVQTSFKLSLLKNCERLLKDGVIKDYVSVKFSGDGTWVGKRLHVVNFTYTIIEEGKRAMADKGNYCLAIMKIKENYDEIRHGLKDLINEMRTLSEIIVNGRTLNVVYYLGGDWKFLACVCGIGAANSEYACIWCTCSKKERCKKEMSWSITDESKGARTVDKISVWQRRGRYSCKNVPLFDFIPVKNVVIDVLHLFLRISDVLIQELIIELKRSDAINDHQIFNKGFDREKNVHMAEYESFLRKDLNISFNWNVNRDSKKLEYRDLTGPEKIKLFENIDLSSIIGNQELALKMQKLWDSFFKLISEIKGYSYDDWKIDSIKAGLVSWLDEFLALFQSKDVTPYIHAFVNHVPEFLQLHGGLNVFNQQGLEKFNDVSTKMFFKGTNMRGIEALRQSMLKRHRIHVLETEGHVRERRIIKCRNCQGSGHTVLTCMNPCGDCGTAICCKHLTKVGNVWLKECIQYVKV